MTGLHKQCAHGERNELGATSASGFQKECCLNSDQAIAPMLDTGKLQSTQQRSVNDSVTYLPNASCRHQSVQSHHCCPQRGSRHVHRCHAADPVMLVQPVISVHQHIEPIAARLPQTSHSTFVKQATLRSHHALFAELANLYVQARASCNANIACTHLLASHSSLALKHVPRTLLLI